LRHAGAPEHVLAQKGEALTDRLLARFESEEGYRNFPDTIPTRECLLT
jgi:hypothetical protein